MQKSVNSPKEIVISEKNFCKLSIRFINLVDLESLTIFIDAYILMNSWAVVKHMPHIT